MKKIEWIPALLLSSTVAVTATFAVAQMGPKAGHKHKMECPMMGEGMHVDMTATVEKTAGGAVVRIQAKNAADAPRVQELAEMMAKHLQEGCPMHEHKGHGKEP